MAGASPGSVEGTAIVDAAKLEGMLGPYLGKGSAGPDWSPDYVELDGKQVLVVTVEPPRWGHPIWMLRTEYSPDSGGPGFPAATIFVRQKASTEPHTVADLEMLTRRAAASTSTVLGGLDVVMSANSRAVPLNLADTAFESWLASEAEALKLPPEAPRVQRPQDRPVVDLTTDPKPKGIGAADIIAAAGIDSLLSGAFERQDTRSRDLYKAEVTNYLRRARKRLSGVTTRSAIRRGYGKVS